MSKINTVFRVHFICHETQYEIFAKQVCESEMFGFIEIEEFIFGDATSIVVDPSVEKVKQEFIDVKRTYIPMHSILRIDEVSKEGTGKAIDTKTGNISHFPHPFLNKKHDGKD